MDIFAILSLIGGLALFLYGMNVMGDGLTKVSGGKLEKILEKLTSNPIKAVLLGAGVTAVIQSSSATTVMVVGFVNSGIMKLSQAVGIIMGCQCGYYDYIMDLESFRYPKQQFFYPDAEANLIFPDSGNHRSASDDVIKK